MLSCVQYRFPLPHVCFTFNSFSLSMQSYILLTLGHKHHTAASVITKQIAFCQHNYSPEQINCVQSY